MSKAWVLVADSTKARFFSASSPAGELNEIKDMAHPESRMHGTEMELDKPGRSYDSVGAGRHAVEGKSSVQEQERNIFSKQVADYLNQAQTSGEFEYLYVISSPSFLGLLKPKLSKATESVLKGAVDKDITSEGIDMIRSYLPEQLWMV